MTTEELMNHEKQASGKKDFFFSFLRYMISLTFIASGMMKSINPEAAGQSVGAYLGLFGLDPRPAGAIAALFCIAETAIGYMALYKPFYYRLHWCYSITMVFFTYVTYVNITDIYGGVESCGCFGEFIHLDPRQSFYKNLALLLICAALSLHIALNYKKPRLPQPLPTFTLTAIAIAIASASPIAFAFAFMHRIGPSAYLSAYAAVCLASSLLVILPGRLYSRRRLVQAMSVALPLMLTSCEGDVEKALDLADDNRTELTKVLDHFRNDPDPLKYEAARFIISNMPYHSSCTGPTAERYDSAYMAMAGEPIQFRDSVFRQAAEGIDFSRATVPSDVRSLDSDFLVKAIDEACEAWQNSSWHEDYGKEYFFEYVLPYRILNEQPSSWRESVSKEFPMLRADEIASKRGMVSEAEAAMAERAGAVETESASGGWMTVLDNPESAVVFTINSPLPSRKRIFLRYTATDGDARVRFLLNGSPAGEMKLDPTKSMRIFRDSREGIEVNLNAGDNRLTVAYGNGDVGLDHITVSAVEPFGKTDATDLSAHLYRIKNHFTDNYITFDTLRSSLLNEMRMLPKTNGDSCSMLRLINRGVGCWSIFPFKKDTTDLCLEVQYCRTDEGAPMSQYHYLNGNHQKWVFLPCGGGLYRIMSKDSGLFLEAVPDSDGTERILQRQYAGRPAQKWLLEKCGANRLPDPTYTWGSPIAEALRVYDVTNRFEWIAFSGALPPRASSLIEAKTGNCRDEAAFTVLLCRYLGIPAAMDFTPHWGNRSQSHSWSVLIKPDGTHTPFYMGCAPGDTVHYYHSYIKPKVLRHRYSLNREIAADMRHETSVPKLFRHADFIDVTDEYYTTTDVEREVPAALRDRNVAYICVFDNRNWVPVYYGNIRGGKVIFPSMGRNIVYMAATYSNGKIETFGNPFLLTSGGEVEDIAADSGTKQDMTILRKYPFMGRQDHFNGRMSGGRFQGSAMADFSTATDIHVHEGITDGNWYDVAVDCNRPFRYVRYIGPAGSHCNVNEIEFFGSDGKKLEGTVTGTDGEAGQEKEKVFDGDILTGFNGVSPDGHWVGLRFRHPENITRIRYIPRNDGNCIEIGDEYELMYWKDNGWKSLGKQTATDNRLLYKNIPSGGLYVVRNLTKGHEERIFTYIDEKQIWW